MKVIKNLDKGITGYDGAEMLINGKPLVIKDLMMQYVGSYVTQDGKESIAVNAIGQKLYDTKKDKVEFTDDEYKLLLKATDKPQHITMVYAPMRLAIEAP